MIYYSRKEFLKQAAFGAIPMMVLPRFITSASQSQEFITTETVYGKLKGVRHNGVNIFKGIQYAGRVSGERRFLTPAPLQPWTGVKDALRLGPPSLQKPNQTYGINEPDPAEDCLTLNVWTPANDNKKRPVMVYSHGGGYIHGSAGSVSQDGSNLARRYDVVVVATNHRLGLLGYLYLDEIAGDEYAGSGNRGVQDIAIALKWVHENISEFGGDPGNVMIFGESGGGLKTSCLYAMPEAKPYFHKASIESGPGVRMKNRDVAAETTEMLLKELDISKRNLQKLLAVPISTLLDTQVKLQRMGDRPLTAGGFKGIGATGAGGFGPVIDGVVLPNQPFDPAAPSISKEKPLLVGWNEDEQIFFSMFSGDTAAFSLDEESLRDRLQNNFGDDAQTILDAYDSTMQDASPTEKFIAIQSIAIMGLGSVNIAEKKTGQRGAPAYLYNFGYKSEVKVPGTDYEFGSMHAMDIQFKFYNVAARVDRTGQRSTGLAGNREERFKASDNMCQFWTSFARTGKPSTDSQPEWPAYNFETRPTMRIDVECEVIEDRFSEELAMWRNIFNP